MKKESFWSSEVGKMSVACIILLLAFPVALMGLNGSIALLYVSLVMILGALVSAPIMTLMAHLKKK